MALVKFVQGPYLRSYPLKPLKAINSCCNFYTPEGIFLLVKGGLIGNYVILFFLPFYERFNTIISI